MDASPTKSKENEMEDILKSFDSEDSRPSDSFKQGLKRSLLTNVGMPAHKFNLFSYMREQFSSRKSTALLLSLGVFLFFSTIALSGFMTYKQFFSRPSDQEILANFIKNNRSATPPTTTESRKVSQGGMGAENDSSEMLMMPARRDYAYEHSKVTYTLGNAISRCDNYSWLKNLGSDEYWSYFDNTGSSAMYSKSESKDPSGKLTNVWLQTDEYSIEYKGGSYAMKSIGIAPVLYKEYLYDEGDNMPVDTEENPDQSTPSEEVPQREEAPVEESEQTITDSDINAFFGPDVTVSGSTIIDGRTYFIIDQSYDSYCSSPTKEADAKEVMRYYADSETYQSKIVEIYLGSVSDTNLVYRTVTSLDQSNVPYTQVADQFTFTYNVPVREKDISSTAVNGRLVDYLARQNVSMVTPTDSAFTLSYMDVPQFNIEDSHYYDRAFYPNTPAGQQQYDEMTTWIRDTQSLAIAYNLGFSKSTETDYYGIDVYSLQSDASTEKILTHFYGDMSSNNYSYSQSSVALKVNGQTISGNLFDISYPEEGRIEPGNSGSGDVPVSIDTEPSADSEIIAPDVTTPTCGQTGGYCTDKLVTFTVSGTYYVALTRGNIPIDTITNYLQFSTISSGNRSAVENLINSIPAPEEAWIMREQQ